MKLLVSLVRPALAISVLLAATSAASSDPCQQLQGQLAAARQKIVDADAIIENPYAGLKLQDYPVWLDTDQYVRAREAAARNDVSKAVREQDRIRREMDIERCAPKLRPARARPETPPVPILDVPRRPPQQTAAPSGNLPPLPSPPGSESAKPAPRESLPPLPPPVQSVALPERPPSPPPAVADLPPLPPAPGARSNPPASTPVIRAPVIRAPVVRAPPVEIPQVRAPPVQIPVVRAPPVEIPQVRAPPVSAPVIRAPTIRAPQIEAPNIRGPRVGTPNRRPAPALTPDRPPPNTRVVARPRHPTMGGGRVAPRSTATVIRVQPRVHRPPPIARAAPQARPRMPAQPVWTRVQGQRRR